MHKRRSSANQKRRRQRKCIFPVFEVRSDLELLQCKTDARLSESKMHIQHQSFLIPQYLNYSMFRYRVGFLTSLLFLSFQTFGTTV
jgi:hypothetical protein